MKEKPPTSKPTCKCRNCGKKINLKWLGEGYGWRGTTGVLIRFGGDKLFCSNTCGVQFAIKTIKG